MSSCGERGEVEEEVLKQIRPSRLQLRTLRLAFELVRGKLDEGLRGTGLKYQIEPEGSFAKGTLLRDRWELDVFVIIDGVSREWVNKNGERLLLNALAPLPTVVKYSEHPYVTVSLMGLEIDVVPVVNVLERGIEGTPLMGVERTPLHTRFVKSRLNECLADEVRLLKSFLKGIGAYGAEAHIGGFSGYLSELLVIHYGSFRSVIKAMASWRPPVFIDPTGSADRSALLRRYPDSPIIVVDPVDPLRNAAAAVTLEKLSLAIVAAKLYEASPSKEFFHAFSRRVKVSTPLPYLVAVCSGDFKGVPPADLWGRLQRLGRSLASALSARGYEALLASVYTNESDVASMAIMVAQAASPVRVVKGPEAWMPLDNIYSFISKRLSQGGAVFVSDRLLGVEPRSPNDLVDFAERWLSANKLYEGVTCKAWLIEEPKPPPGARVPRSWLEELYSLPAWITSLSGRRGF